MVDTIPDNGLVTIGITDRTDMDVHTCPTRFSSIPITPVITGTGSIVGTHIFDTPGAGDIIIDRTIDTVLDMIAGRGCRA